MSQKMSTNTTVANDRNHHHPNNSMKLQTVHEMDGEASHEYKTLVSCERELQDLAGLRLKTLE